MKKLLLTAGLFFTLFSAHSQQADQRIGELLNQSDWFALEEEYPLLKDSMQSACIRLLAETMIANNFNQPQQALESIGKLLEDYQAELGPENAGNLFTLATILDAEAGNYAQAADNLKYFLDQLKTASPQENIASLEESYHHYSRLRNYPAPSLSRPSADVEIPVSIEEVKLPKSIEKKGFRGTTIHIPVTVHGREYPFIFDTGAASSYFSERFAKEVGVRIIHDSVLINKGMLGASYGMNGYLDSLQVGDITFRNLIVYIGRPNAAVDSVLQVDAVLGMDFIKLAGETQIYPQEQKIVFPARFTPLPATGRNLLLDNSNRPVIKARAGDNRLEFFFDTGNNTADLSYTYYAKYKDRVDAVASKDTVTGGGFGFIRTKEVLRIPCFAFKVGQTPVEIKNIMVSPAPGNDQPLEDGNMGMELVNQFRKVTINLKDMFVELE